MGVIGQIGGRLGVLGLRKRGGGWAPGSLVPLRAPLLALHTPRSRLCGLSRGVADGVEKRKDGYGAQGGEAEGRAARGVGRLSRDEARWGDPAGSAPGFGDILG